MQAPAGGIFGPTVGSLAALASLAGLRSLQLRLPEAALPGGAAGAPALELSRLTALSRLTQLEVPRLVSKP